MNTPVWETPWPDGVIARYLTAGGATVDIQHNRRYYDETALLDAVARCIGCGLTEGFDDGDPRDLSASGILTMNVAAARAWAQAHAEKCRALPMPGGAQ
ncbi:MAG: hypothetical protein JO362_20245 [Streptomycetaceae bacterium]|nr:hypothetical protein [Streptomycetaceae bacterium]